MRKEEALYYAICLEGLPESDITEYLDNII